MVESSEDAFLFNEGTLTAEVNSVGKYKEVTEGFRTKKEQKLSVSILLSDREKNFQFKGLREGKKGLELEVNRRFRRIEEKLRVILLAGNHFPDSHVVCSFCPFPTPPRTMDMHPQFLNF